MKQKLKLLLLLMLGMGLANCAREAGIVENPLLKNGVMQVLVLKEKPADVQLLLDSIDNIPKAELAKKKVVIEDTVTATINDTLWVVGRLKDGKPERVRNYFWEITGQKTVEKRNNNDLLPVVFSDSGYYQTVFKARDDLGGRDSAGIGQWIKIINTSPTITFSRDTTWARHKGPAQLEFTAQDSLGFVDSVWIKFSQLDAWDSGRAYLDEAVVFNIPKVANQVNSQGDQRVVVGARDDDANLTTDTTWVHFNHIPQVEQTYPAAQSRVNIFERFAFYWSGKDTDNPQDLRYSLRVGKVPVLTSTHTVVSNILEKSWELVDTAGVLLTESLKGHLYWQVIAHDGYDTVVTETQRFYLGDPNVRFAQIKGWALLQGRTDHSGIRISLISTTDGGRQVTRTALNSKNPSQWSFAEVEPGCYHLEAIDTVDLYYTPARVQNICVEVGDDQQIDTLWLLDKSKPIIRINSIYDTLVTTRELEWKGFFVDSGSFVNPVEVKAWLNGNPLGLTGVTAQYWTANMSDLPDGINNFKMVARDHVGNVSDTLKINFPVKATKINLQVNGAGGALVLENDQLSFVLTIKNALPPPKYVYWDLRGNETLTRKDSVGVLKGEGVTFTLDTTIAASFEQARYAIATLELENGTIYKDTVSYWVRDRNKISVLIVNPSRDTTVNLRNVVNLKALAEASEGFEITEIAWDLDGSGNYATVGEQTQFSSDTSGVFKIKVRTTDDNYASVATYDSVQVSVASSPPFVRVSSKADTVKINGDIYLNATITDNGIIEKIEWKCGAGEWLESETPAYTMIAPAQAGMINCIVRATDDDGEVGQDTTKVLVKQDAPYVKVHQKNATVTIKDSLKLNATIKDTLGTIERIEWSCGVPGVGGVSNWMRVSKADTSVIAPASAVDNWLCVIRVTDDDGLTARDTSKFKVLLDPPRVKVVDDSLLVKINASINLDAIAYDSLGRIVSYEWSCGNASAIGSGTSPWVSYASPKATVTAPSVGDANYMCVIRVMDDDGLYARDTTFIKVSQEAPQVTVKRKEISVRVNTQFTVDCEANETMGTISHYDWSCGAPGVAGTNGTWVSLQTSWYIATAPAQYAANYICIVRALDEDGLYSQDTTKVIVVEPPTATLQVTDSVVVWSGDTEIPESYRYWGEQINATASALGRPWGDANNKQYWWHFSNFHDVWLLGLSDGTISHEYAGFNEALIRPTQAGNITVRLNFQDSILPGGEHDPETAQDFYVRHFDSDEITVKFYRAWRNVNAVGDTVVQKGERAMGLVVDGENPVVAFRAADGKGWVKKWNGSSWANVGGGSFATSADTIRLARDSVSKDIVVAYRTSTGLIEVKKSAGGTGNWVHLSGNSIVNGYNTKNLTLAASHSKIALAWVGNDNASYLTIWNGTAWGWGDAWKPAETVGWNTSKVDVAFSKNGDSLAVAYSDIYYRAYLRIAKLSNMASKTISAANTAHEAADAVSVAYAPNGRIYLAHNDRNNLSPRVAYYASNKWTAVSTAGYANGNVSLHNVGRSTNIVVDGQNRPIVSYDDNFFAPYVNVWRYESNKWVLQGESKLPYFAEPFLSTKGYYLNGLGPKLALSKSGVLYVGMQGVDSRGANANNSGPLVFKYQP